MKIVISYCEIDGNVEVLAEGREIIVREPCLRASGCAVPVQNYLYAPLSVVAMHTAGPILAASVFERNHPLTERADMGAFRCVALVTRKVSLDIHFEARLSLKRLPLRSPPLSARPAACTEAKPNPHPDEGHTPENPISTDS
jgi:hypothetical protein